MGKFGLLNFFGPGNPIQCMHREIIVNLAAEKLLGYNIDEIGPNVNDGKKADNKR